MIAVAIIQIPDTSWHLSWQDDVVNAVAEQSHIPISRVAVLEATEFAKRIDADGVSDLLIDALDN